MPTDTERLNRLLRFLNSHPVISNNGGRKFSRKSIDRAYEDFRRKPSRRGRKGA